MASTLHNPGIDDKERVRAASDIVRVVGEFLALRPKGREYVGLCPFHDDHKPSMCVVPDKQIFHCFSCGAGGDVFSFVQRFLKMDFREALEHLAQRANITLSPRARGSAPESASDRGGLLEVASAAQDFFRAIFRHPEHGRAARELLERRRISPAMAEAFGIGAAPARWDGLLSTIEHKGLDTAPFRELGLLKARDAGGLYDAFRNRLMFPIRDKAGRVIAFGGRRIDDQDEPKYINSPESALFDKSATLFGLDAAMRSIQKERTAVITEGYTDAIACHQAGLTHAVATLGTALTPAHARELRRLCDVVVLLFDGDEAGQRASDRAVEVFFAESIDVKIATLSGVTDAKDPDELLKRPDGLSILQRAIASAEDALEYRYRLLRRRAAGQGTSALERAITEELARLSELGLNRASPMRRQLILRRLHEITGLPAELIARSVPAGRRAAIDAAPAPVEPRRPLNAEEHALGCVLCQPELWGTLDGSFREWLGPGSFADPRSAAVSKAITGVASSGRSPALAEVIAALGPDSASWAVSLWRAVDAQTERNQERLHAHWTECLKGVATARTRDAVPPELSPMDRIEHARQVHAAFGGDRRALPRPAG